MHMTYLTHSYLCANSFLCEGDVTTRTEDDLSRHVTTVRNFLYKRINDGEGRENGQVARRPVSSPHL